MNERIEKETSSQVGGGFLENLDILKAMSAEWEMEQ